MLSLKALPLSMPGVTLRDRDRDSVTFVEVLANLIQLAQFERSDLISVATKLVVFGIELF